MPVFLVVKGDICLLTTISIYTHIGTIKYIYVPVLVFSLFPEACARVHFLTLHTDVYTTLQSQINTGILLYSLIYESLSKGSIVWFQWRENY
jgi:hypothetical protein